MQQPPPNPDDAVQLAAYEDEQHAQTIAALWEQDTPRVPLDPILINLLAEDVERVVPVLAGGQLPEGYALPRVQTRGRQPIPPRLFAELSMLDEMTGAFDATRAATTDEGLAAARVAVLGLLDPNASADLTSSQPAAPPPPPASPSPPAVSPPSRAGAELVAGQGETWSALAKRAGVNMIALLRANRVYFDANGQPPPLVAGQPVRLPR